MNPPATILATVAYEPAATDEPGAERGRIDFAAGGAADSDAELRYTLRVRLRAFAFAIGTAFALTTIVGVVFDPKKTETLLAALTEPPCYGLHIPVALAQGVVVILLRPSGNWTLPRLRAMEWVVFAPLVAFSVYNEVLDLDAGSADLIADAPKNMSNSKSILWLMLMISYGVLIPNTWRRCAAAVGLFAVLGLVPEAIVLPTRNLAPGLVAVYLANKAFWLILATMVVVYGARRVELLRREASEARKLGQYLLREKLGSGGMGEVYRAEHALLRRPCAVKLIRPDRAADPAALARFEREVQATAALAHPHVVRIFDYGRADDGTFYCVMEFLPGVTLDELVKRHGSLPPERVVFLLRQLCSALAEAHAAGLTHRDVKPGNVIVRDGGRQSDSATLLDFGLVLDRAGGDEKLTAHGAVAGTPAYMAPEQAAGDPVDARADVYAVGAVGYFLLSGRPPFASGSAMRTIAAVLTEPARPLDGVPTDLAAVVMRCLMKSPADRFQTADELDAALAGCGCGGWSHGDAAAWWADRQPGTTAADPTRTFTPGPGATGAASVDR